MAHPGALLAEQLRHLVHDSLIRDGYVADRIGVDHGHRVQRPGPSLGSLDYLGMELACGRILRAKVCQAHAIAVFRLKGSAKGYCDLLRRSWPTSTVAGANGIVENLDAKLIRHRKALSQSSVKVLSATPASTSAGRTRTAKSWRFCSSVHSSAGG